MPCCPYYSGPTQRVVDRQTGEIREAQQNVDRYIAGYERVRLLAWSHPPEEIPPLANMSRSLVKEYLELLEEFEGQTPVETPRDGAETPTSSPSRDEIAAHSASHASADP